MELTSDLETLLRSIGDGNWQVLSSRSYAKPVHLVLEVSIYSLWGFCPGVTTEKL